MPIILLAVVAVFLTALPAFAQAVSGRQGGPPVAGLPPRDTSAPEAAPKGTARITGRALSADGAVLRRARIQLAGEAGLQRVTTSDAEGRYRFDALPAGRFTLIASKAGYVTLQFGQRHPFEAGREVSLSDGQAKADADFRLPRGSVIAGRI